MNSGHITESVTLTWPLRGQAIEFENSMQRVTVDISQKFIHLFYYSIHQFVYI